MKAPNHYEGILPLSKPTGINSFKLVSVLRKVLNIKKIGHAGTLDPFATGVMVMLIGKPYTRMSDQFMNCDKEYLAEVHLGAATDTYDCDGQVTSESPIIPSFEEIQEKLSLFQGQVEQIPPMYSAKKVGGKKLYDLARKGEEIERKPCLVTMETQLVDYTYPKLTLKITCSKGTYVRSIAHDLGQLLGCGAHLSKLERSRSGTYKIEQCLDAEKLISELSIDMKREAILQHLQKSLDGNC